MCFGGYTSEGTIDNQIWVMPLLETNSSTTSSAFFLKNMFQWFRVDKDNSPLGHLGSAYHATLQIVHRKDSLIILGGENSENQLNSLLYENIDFISPKYKIENVMKKLIKRKHHNMVQLNEFMVVLGGVDQEGNTELPIQVIDIDYGHYYKLKAFQR